MMSGTPDRVINPPAFAALASGVQFRTIASICRLDRAPPILAGSDMAVGALVGWLACVSPSGQGRSTRPSRSPCVEHVSRRQPILHCVAALEFLERAKSAVSTPPPGTGTCPSPPARVFHHSCLRRNRGLEISTFRCTAKAHLQSTCS